MCPAALQPDRAVRVDDLLEGEGEGVLAGVALAVRVAARDGQQPEYVRPVPADARVLPRAVADRVGAADGALQHAGPRVEARIAVPRRVLDPEAPAPELEGVGRVAHVVHGGGGERAVRGPRGLASGCRCGDELEV